jgi:hypothetical protein
MSDSSGMMIVVLMVVSCMACCCIACAVWIMANEGILEGDFFDAITWDGYDDFMNKNGDDGDDGDDDDDGGDDDDDGGDDGAGTGDDDGEESGEYNPGCVYLYENTGGKKYIRSLCVDKKTPERYWESGEIHGLSSMRVGEHVRVNLATRDRSKGTKKFNGEDANTIIELKDEGFNDKAGGISMAWKKYDTNNKLKSVGEPRDEKRVYLYLDDDGKGFIDSIKSKSSETLDITVKDKPQYVGVSSVRVGKDVELVIYEPGSANVQWPIATIKGKGTDTPVNLHALSKEKGDGNVGELKDSLMLKIKRR